MLHVYWGLVVVVDWLSVFVVSRDERRYLCGLSCRRGSEGARRGACPGCCGRYRGKVICHGHTVLLGVVALVRWGRRVWAILSLVSGWRSVLCGGGLRAVML